MENAIIYTIIVNRMKVVQFYFVKMVNAFDCSWKVHIIYRLRFTCPISYIDSNITVRKTDLQGYENGDTILELFFFF